MGTPNMQTQPEAIGAAPQQLRSIQIPTVEEIQDWLVIQIAEQLGVDPNTIDIRVPFSSNGLTSLQVTSITALGEKMFGLPLSPLILWNFPNVESLSQFIAEELARSDTEMLEI